jgi:DNA-binding transcriptional MerR regulator/methylmalonyl-CoA mutase cobalamin-binding subunit
MYTIKQAALRSGVAVSTIRAWERRYGVVAPARTDCGYRLYDEDSIARLRAMRGLIEAGWSAAQAAQAVVASPPSALETVGAPAAVSAAIDAEALVDAAGAYDLGAIERALDAMFYRGSFEAVIDDLVLPAVAALGAAWAGGRIDVAAEHLASAAVSRRLAALFDLAGLPGSGPKVLVGLPPTARHEIGAAAFAVALRRRGVDVLYLGPDVPLDSWVDAATESRAAAAVIGVVMATDVSPAADVAAAVRAARPDIVLSVGGAAAGLVPASVSAAVLPTRVTEAAAVLVEGLDRRA